MKKYYCDVCGQNGHGAYAGAGLFVIEVPAAHGERKEGHVCYKCAENMVRIAQSEDTRFVTSMKEKLKKFTPPEISNIYQ